MKLLTEGREKKTKRLQLVIRPSLYEKLQDLKSLCGLSINEIVSQVLEEHIDDLIDAYKKPDIIQEDPVADNKEVMT